MRKPITARAKCSPVKMKSPLYKTGGPGDKKETKATSTKPMSIEESLKKQYPNKAIKRDKKNPNKFRVFSDQGNSFTVTRHASKPKKTITTTEAVAMEFKKKK